MDLELDKNKLLIEIKELKLKQSITPIDSNSVSNNTNNINDINIDTNNNNTSNILSKDSKVLKNISNSISVKNEESDDLALLDHNMTTENLNTEIVNTLEREIIEKQQLNEEISSNSTTIINQFVKLPLNNFFDSFNLYSFNGYEKSNTTTTTNGATDSGTDKSSLAALIKTKTLIATQTLGTPSSTTDSDYDSDTEAQAENSTLNKYHMNLNRYLNLILYKLIFPLMSLNENDDESNNTSNPSDPKINSYDKFNNKNKFQNNTNDDEFHINLL
ncbi:unnamed protein product [[Candida] boidinii]|uniref:Unnamed protein product n=1 Tax=Candida boidinii TaxID=5477 RepID=A0ACB5U322_CANBO|nr:unnamed protein product [[Candida] boidinii]